MFLKFQKKDQIEYYQEMLKAVASLSGLFSESSEPYIHYRVAENLFCKSFVAKNHARADSSVDASLRNIGIGIKTFLNKNGKTMQKIAEFNGDHNLFRGLEGEEKIKKIAELRNRRLDVTKRIFNLEKLIYHCVTRSKGKIFVYETPMDFIDLKKIKLTKNKGNIIEFTDKINEYSFNISKSTLYKRFILKDSILNFPTKVLDDPFETLEKIFKKSPDTIFSPLQEKPHIFLPLYSVTAGEKFVPEKGTLNQWNAKGRLVRVKGTVTPRNMSEAYIKIPLWIHRIFPNFFPGKDTPFNLILPSGEKMSAKVCQQGSKALFSNPNPALGTWILRDVLNLKEKELLTYKKLEEIGIDSVVIYKNRKGEYSIDFRKIGSYEKFEEENKV